MKNKYTHQTWQINQMNNQQEEMKKEIKLLNENKQNLLHIINHNHNNNNNNNNNINLLNMKTMNNNNNNNNNNDMKDQDEDDIFYQDEDEHEQEQNNISAEEKLEQQRQMEEYFRLLKDHRDSQQNMIIQNKTTIIQP